MPNTGISHEERGAQQVPPFATSHSPAVFHAAQDGRFHSPSPLLGQRDPVRRCSYWETSYSSCESKGHHLRRCTGQLFQRGVAGRERKMACHPLRTFIRWDSGTWPSAVRRARDEEKGIACCGGREARGLSAEMGVRP